MQPKWRLKRTKQCANCPWRVGSDLSQIPGYAEQLHRSLEGTIAKSADPNDLLKKELKNMACHYSTDEPEHCIGWLVNQVGEGNNLLLRYQMLFCENRDEIEVYGEQHKHYIDTLPKAVDNKENQE